MSRRESTDDRKKLHKTTHDWSRKRYRELLLGKVEAETKGGNRVRLDMASRRT